MKTKSLLKLALMMVAMFAFVGVFAQGTAVPGAATVTFTDDSPIYMVTGTTVPVYAEPDAVYHSSWAYGSDWSLTAGFLWNWTADNAGITFSQTGVNDNYVEITAAGAAGTTTVISVTEEASAAFGGCEGAATNLTVNIVATPDAVLDGAGTSESFCVGDAGIPAAVNATISGGWQNYRLVWTLEIATLGAGLVEDEWFDTDRTTSLGGALAYAEEFTTAVPEEVAASGVHAITSVGGFTVIGGKPTVYTYTLTSINDQALRFGDYLTLTGDDTNPAAFTYNAIGETYTIQINPAPSTGPIFHIPSTWAN